MVHPDLMRVSLPADRNNSVATSRVPRGGRLAMIVILVAMALLSIYSNVQKARRHRIEQVTITPAASVSAPPTPTPAQP